MSSIKIQSHGAVKLANRALNAKLYEKKGFLKGCFEEIIRTGKSDGIIVVLAVDVESDLPVGVALVRPKSWYTMSILTRNVHIFVARKYRRLGVASMMLEHLDEKRNIPSYLLNTSASLDPKTALFFKKHDIFQLPNHDRLKVALKGLLNYPVEAQALAVFTQVRTNVLICEIRHVEQAVRRYVRKKFRS